MGHLWDAFSGRIYHWNQSQNALVNEVWPRIKSATPTDPVARWFTKWYEQFFAGCGVFLLDAFEHKHPIDEFFWSRIKAFSKETYRYLHCVFLCHHLHAIRDSLDEHLQNIISVASTLLGIPESNIADSLRSYEGKNEATDVCMNTWRQICLTLGADQTKNLLASVLWIERIARVAQIASSRIGL